MQGSGFKPRSGTEFHDAATKSSHATIQDSCDVLQPRPSTANKWVKIKQQNSHPLNHLIKQCLPADIHDNKYHDELQSNLPTSISNKLSSSEVWKSIITPAPSKSSHHYHTGYTVAAVSTAAPMEQLLRLHLAVWLSEKKKAGEEGRKWLNIFLLTYNKNHLL